MNDIQQKEAAKQFAAYWKGKGAQRAPERPGAGTLMENRKRNVHLHVMVTSDELAAIHERMAEAGISNAGLMYGKWL